MSNSQHSGELFIALIAPLGANLDLVQSELDSGLIRVGYKYNNIKLTQIISENSDLFDLDYENEFDRYQKYIKAGNEFCRLAKRRDALVVAGIAKIHSQFPGRQGNLPKRTAHVFRQIKRVEEVKTLKEVYGQNIIFLGCYAPRKIRIKNLVALLQKEHRTIDYNSLEARALELIAVDENEKDVVDGQRFLDAYPFSDFIVDCSHPTSIRSSIERFIECFFGSPFVSPTRDEHGMYIAHTASLRSADLSRQVGAAIFGDRHEIISLGCNEVPAAGGGTYWLDSTKDARDFQIGYDSNARIKMDMVRDVFDKLKTAGWLSDAHMKQSSEVLALDALKEEDNNYGPLSRAMVSDVIEYGRMVHAEMSAITDAARFGRSVSNGTLYCTTMPCHLCTKLIVSSGISEVQFLQPYFKSLVRELYEDSVAVDEEGVVGKVHFKHFRGVTPNSFRAIFQKFKRKDAMGNAIRWNMLKSRPINITDYPTYINAELVTLSDFGNILTSIGIKVE